MKIYLDNCCFNRLFDDRQNIKNYLEREAILIIMQKAYDQELEIVGSDILKLEMTQIKNSIKRNDVLGVYNFLVQETADTNPQSVKRAKGLLI